MDSYFKTGMKAPFQGRGRFTPSVEYPFPPGRLPPNPRPLGQGWCCTCVQPGHMAWDNPFRGWEPRWVGGLRRRVWGGGVGWCEWVRWGGGVTVLGWPTGRWAALGTSAGRLRGQTHEWKAGCGCGTGEKSFSWLSGSKKGRLLSQVTPPPPGQGTMHDAREILTPREPRECPQGGPAAWAQGLG